MANKSRDINDAVVSESLPSIRPTLEAVGQRPMSARSTLLSYLLGVPGRPVSAQHLVSVGALFGLRSGTVRTALSRLTTAGDVESTADGYRVTGTMRDRQSQQERGLADPGGTSTGWDGTWWTALVVDESRPMAARRRFRSVMLGARMGELRPEVWMRPADVEPPPSLTGVALTRGTVDGVDGRELVGRLWDIPASEITARRLLEAIDVLGAVAAGDESVEWFAPAFEVSAACVSFLRTEPALPADLVETPIATDLRESYRALNARFRTALAEHLPPAGRVP
ncbi:MAG: PaaX domain-containing protein, C- domain protein [Actinomycetota bacterium]